jgi:hypothetical protein
MTDILHRMPTRLSLPPEIPFPPAPWHATAQLWAGLFQANVPAVLPAGLTPLIGSRSRVIALLMPLLFARLSFVSLDSTYPGCYDG